MTTKTKKELLEEIEELRKELKDKEKYEQYEKCADEMAIVFKSFEDRGFSRTEIMELIKINTSNI